jgi:UDP-3-O-[3-hydroxymyristoyl] glucosamine N-acyltransferase
MGAIVSPLAYVAPWVQLGDGCVVHPFAVVGQLPSSSRALARQPVQTKALRIGNNTVICPHAVIYAGSDIGADCLIGDGASIREGADIGDRCVIGRHVTLLYDVTLEHDVRIQDMTHITGGCRIGANSFFGPSVVTCNNRRVDLNDYHHPGSNPCTFGRQVMVGAGAHILAGCHVGDYALIGIGALVVCHVPDRGRVIGPKGSVFDPVMT